MIATMGERSYILGPQERPPCKPRGTSGQLPNKKLSQLAQPSTGITDSPAHKRTGTSRLAKTKQYHKFHPPQGKTRGSSDPSRYSHHPPQSLQGLTKKRGEPEASRRLNESPSRQSKPLRKSKSAKPTTHHFVTKVTPSSMYNAHRQQHAKTHLTEHRTAPQPSTSLTPSHSQQPNNTLFQYRHLWVKALAQIFRHTTSKRWGRYNIMFSNNPNQHVDRSPAPGSTLPRTSPMRIAPHHTTSPTQPQQEPSGVRQLSILCHRWNPPNRLPGRSKSNGCFGESQPFPAAERSFPDDRKTSKNRRSRRLSGHLQTSHIPSSMVKVVEHKHLEQLKVRRSSFYQRPSTTGNHDNSLPIVH